MPLPCRCIAGRAAAVVIAVLNWSDGVASKVSRGAFERAAQGGKQGLWVLRWSEEVTCKVSKGLVKGHAEWKTRLVVSAPKRRGNSRVWG